MTPSLETIIQARMRLLPVIHATPLQSSQTLNRDLGMDIRFKPENLQVTGSFKIRGAFNKVAQLHQAGSQGVVTASSGNHGQAVAWAARYFSLAAHIVVPSHAPKSKILGAKSYGAQVEFCGTTSQERLDRAQSLAREEHLDYVPPYDDVLVMSGQGTIGLEIVEEWPDVETVLVPIGGGGLISGIATAIKAARPDVRLVGVEPAGAPKAETSRRQGRRIILPHTASIADGLISSSLGQYTYPIIEALVDEVVTVPEDAIQEALWLLMSRLKTVAEPSGAVTTAYLLSKPKSLKGRRVVAVLSGGNLDRSVLHQLTE